MIMATKPTHEQAQLHLQVYEQRREARLRQARDWFFKNYFVENFDDSMRIAAPGTENGTHAMMVLSYWEQACALLDYGLLHEDRKSTRLNSSRTVISYAVFCLKKKNNDESCQQHRRTKEGDACS